MESIRYKERSQIFGKLRDMESVSEKEAEALLQDLLGLEKQKQELEEQFMKDLRKVISAKKTFILMKTEMGFKRRLLKQYKQKQGGSRY